MISEKYKAIFIHIPKTGGTSIKEILKLHGFKICNLNPPDGTDDNKTGKYKLGTANRLKRWFTDEKWNSYFKFCFVRNPYTRMVSNYYFLKLNEVMSFSQFIKFQPNEINNRSSAMRHIIWHSELSQSNHIFNKKGIKMVDFIGKLETIQDDFDKICGKIGILSQKLPHVNKRDDKINVVKK